MLDRTTRTLAKRLLPLATLTLAALILAPATLRAAPAKRTIHHVNGVPYVSVTAPPPAWAYRADGTLRPPSDFHRPKAGDIQVLYLAVDGVHVEPGNDNPERNTSGIPYSAVDIPAFDDERFRRDDLDTRAKVLAALRDWVAFFYAHMMVQVVTDRPPAGSDYTMVVVGGSPGLVDLPQGVLGVSPFDCYRDPNNVAFVFSEDHGSDLEMLVLTIVHEAAHSFGAAHVDDPDGIMNPYNPGSTEDWGSGPVPDGRACDGGSEQDTVAVLKDMLGERADTLPPWIEIVTPGRGALMTPSFTARVQGTDNVSLHSVTLYLNGGVVSTQTLPIFRFRLSGLADGPHRIWAVGEDAHGNQASSGAVDFTVSALCSDLGTCDPGPGGVGDPCANGDECQSGFCATTTVDASAVCSKPCSVQSPCLAGTICEGADPVSGRPGYCVSTPGAGIRLLDAQSAFALRGCSTVPVSSLPLALAFSLALLAWLRRRK